jgi:putative CocE/NonD family hydrolase
MTPETFAPRLRGSAPVRVIGLMAALAMIASLLVGLAPAAAPPAFADDDPPEPQYPFACTVMDHGLGQPIVDNEAGLGVPVYEEEPDGSWDPETSEIVGYSKDCDAETRYVYYAFGSDGRGYVVRDHGGAGPADLQAIEALLPDGVDLATTAVTDVDGVDEVPYLVRHERGVINRFIYSVSMLVDVDEVVSGDPESADGAVWNGRLLFQFQGGVGIGHSQGRFDDGASRGPDIGTTNDRARAIKGEPDRLGKGYAVIYSTATRTGDHYNLLLGGRTAEMVKDRFVTVHGEPRYTVAVGGSGGGIQQYVYNQNHPELLDAAIPQRSYPDMTTQTIHVGDCALLDRYMDLDAADDPTWQDWDNRRWLQGLNSIDGYFGSTGSQLATIRGLLGLGAQTGSSECLEGWLGLAPLVLNPLFGSESNWDLLGDQVDDIERTHWDDAREAYGTDPETGFARVPWDNVGVQYGLRALQRGDITAEQFLDVNARVGSWKDPHEMVQEVAPFVGVDGGSFGQADIPALIGGQLAFDPWSSLNARLSDDDGQTPAPRRAGDPEAIADAYGSGLVFMGAPEREIPIIEARDHLEHVLDMHNVHQSFAVRQRLLDNQGHSDNLVIWWLETDEDGDSPAVADFYHDAFDTIAEWIGNLEADASLSVAEARPGAAVDRCVDVEGQEIAAGDEVWAGVLDDAADGACTQRFDIFSTSRIEAGAPITGDVWKCQLMPVTTAVEEGLYGDWTPAASDVQRLQTIHPDGVCDYALRGVADPRGDVADAPAVSGGTERVVIDGADPGATVQLRQGGEVVATTTADADGRARPLVAPGVYVVAQERDGERGRLSHPVTVGQVPFPDVGVDSVHLDAIVRLADLGILLGRQDGTYGPFEPVTRGQIASIIARALELEPSDEQVFDDVPPGVTHAGAINALAKAGIVFGRDDGTYDRFASLTRGQLSSILARAAGLPDGQGDTFTDVAGSVHRGAIYALAQAGVIQGFGDGTFRPSAPVMRAQAATFVAGFLDVLGSQAEIRGSIEQIHISRAEPGAEVIHRTPTGVAVHTADDNGALVIREVQPGADNSVEVEGDPRGKVVVEVLSPDGYPGDDFYAEQQITPDGGYLEARDGTLLAYQVVLPDPAVHGDGPYPIVIDYSAYRPSIDFFDGVGTRFPELGYAAVGVNMRGSACSGGAFDYFEQLQWYDGFDMVEAFAAQPWVDGVALIGKSYPGISQLFVAATQPPSLDAIVPGHVIGEFYRDVAYPGGLLNAGFAGAFSADQDARSAFPSSYSQVMARTDPANDLFDPVCLDNQRFRGQNVSMADGILGNDADGAYWEARAPERLVGDITVPTLLINAWQDEQTGSGPAKLLERFDADTPARLIGLNGDHGEYYRGEVFAAIEEFLDLYLAAPDPAAIAAYESRDPVTIMLEVGRGDDAGVARSTFTMESFLASGEGQRWFLQPGGGLAPEAPVDEDASTTYTYVSPPPLPPIENVFAQFMPGQNEWRAAPPDDQSAVFVSEPLAEDLVMAGSASLDLALASESPVSDLEATLIEVRTDGQEMLVQTGWLRTLARALDEEASTTTRPRHLHTASSRAPLTPGEVTDVRVELFPFAHAFREGSRIKISVEAPGGNRWRWGFATFPGEHDNTIWHDATRLSSLVLPVVDVEVELGALADCGAVSSQPCRPVASED